MLEIFTFSAGSENYSYLFDIYQESEKFKSLKTSASLINNQSSLIQHI